VLVSEMMLQQTQASRVVEPWERFMERFPTAQVCAEASLADVLVAWRGLGYHRRAKALHDTAKILCERHGGTVPRTVGELMTLPGVGEYTANAIASFAYGERVAALDTNVGRVLARAVANQTRSRCEARELSTRLLGRSPSARFNQAMIDLGARHCRAKPRCEDCPLVRRCAWRLEGGEDPSPSSAAVSRAQPRFEGSTRQVRGRVLEALREGPRSRRELAASFEGLTTPRRDDVLTGLVSDGLIAHDGVAYSLAAN
jgi:A/G-specific adenine glycosylase